MVLISAWPDLGADDYLIKPFTTIADDLEEPFCFYLIALEGVTIEDPIWFECHEVVLIGYPAVALQPRQNS
jgi:hypothetical protein